MQERQLNQENKIEMTLTFKYVLDLLKTLQSIVELLPFAKKYLSYLSGRHNEF